MAYDPNAETSGWRAARILIGYLLAVATIFYILWLVAVVFA
jgi:hypothetical protein